MNADLTPDAILEAVGPASTWVHNCHGASLKLVRSGLLGPHARVARGSAKGVTSQHSWAIVGDPYDLDAPIVDLSLWSYVPEYPRIWTGTYRDDIHRPHGSGHIMEWGRPENRGGEPYIPPTLDTEDEDVAWWLDMFGPLDLEAWRTLVTLAPAGGWPIGKFLAAADDDPNLSAFVPVDMLGMTTDRNPGGMYQ